MVWFIGCSRPAAATGEASRTAGVSAAANPRPVSIVVAQRAPLADRLTLTAEFHPYQEVDVMAKVSGYVRKIEVDVGARVRQGQLLATVEIPEMDDELRRYSASIERSQAELARATNEVKRAKMAHEMAHLSYTRLAAVQQSRPGLVAQQEIDTVRNRDLLAESQIATAQAALSAAEQSLKMQEADAGRARTMQAYTRVTAPFDGVVSKRFLDPGAMIQAGTSSHTQAMPLLRVSQTHVLRLILPVPESAVPHVQVGTAVTVRAPALNRTLQGRVARFSSRILPATRTMETEVDVPNPGGLLVPGMFAEAELKLAENNSALAVPPAALDREHGETSVLVVNAQNIVERRKITVGLETPDWVEVRNGLREDERVVIGGRNTVRPGQTVLPQPLRAKGGA
jgi:RND family efflux transporter MFP subunit